MLEVIIMVGIVVVLVLFPITVFMKMAEITPIKSSKRKALSKGSRSRDTENDLRDFYREKSRERKDSLRDWDVKFTKSLLDDSTLYYNFTEYMSVIPNGNYVEWSILVRTARISIDIDYASKGIPSRHRNPLPRFLDSLKWENDYLREVTGETIYGVLEYVQDGTDTIGLVNLKHNLSAYKTLGYGSLIDNYVKSTGSTAWRFGSSEFTSQFTADCLTASILTADKLTTTQTSKE